MTNYRKKLIEVDLPLDDINRESAREKSIRHGHPSTLHLWWARRPLAACRAVIFASMVDDPSSCPDEFPTEEEQRAERERLHGIITQLVKWESTDENQPAARDLLAEVRYEIARSVARSRGKIAPPAPTGRDASTSGGESEVLDYLREHTLPIYDPFAGGGSIPLEAQRLGLNAIASDLNPVAVLINKALIELPPKFKHRPPVNPEADPIGTTVGKGRKQQRLPWRGASGLADDIRYYGAWMREEAFKRIGHLYPKVKLPDGSEATVIAWLWARTVPCANPACGLQMPLLKTFQLSKKKNNEHWTRPVVDYEAKRVSFVVQNHNEGVPDRGTVDRHGALCIACNNAAPLSYVREQGRIGNMGEQMTAIVAEGESGRFYASPNDEHIQTARFAEPTWKPTGNLPDRALGFRVQRYGFTQWHQLFTKRQLTALATFNNLQTAVRRQIIQDGGNDNYANAICTYLALAFGREVDMCCSFDRWHNSGEKITGVFGRQAISMIWDFAESNPFSDSTGNWMAHIEWVAKVVKRLPADANSSAAHQADASTTIHAKDGPVIVTDPPYYDNIGYADLSDFFYVWLRPLLRDIYPDLFAGILTPKAEEITAIPARFETPRQRFEDLLNKTLKLIRERCSSEFPSSIFYAYKQQEEEREGRVSTGWETMLSAIVSAGFEIVGTWPMRTEYAVRARAIGSNALASSVVLVCRPRPDDAPTVTRRQFFEALEEELPAALDQLTQKGHIAPTDLAQAAIGPGMQIYSRYGSVETISGEPVPIREALAAINRAIANYDERQEGDLDSESRFCLDWFKQYGYAEGRYGEAETLARAKNVAISKLQDVDRLLTAAGGVVKLLPLDAFAEHPHPPASDQLYPSTSDQPYPSTSDQPYPSTSDQPSSPASDPSYPHRLRGGRGGNNITAWEGCFRMAYHLNREHGEGIVGAARIGRQMGGSVEAVERLGRILYNHYDRNGDSQNAVIFNNLVAEWQRIRVEMRNDEQLGIPIYGELEK